MRYYITPQKGINIPDETIQKYKEVFGIDETDAIQIYLEEEGYQENKELEELEKKGAAMPPVKARKSAPKKESERGKQTKKENTPKKTIIAELVKAASVIGQNVDILNPEKLIQFTYNGERYEIDLKKKRGDKKNA